MTRVALNVMGGDFGPEVRIEGALLAKTDEIDITLVGDEAVVRPYAEAFDVLPTTENIPFDVANAATAYRRSKDNPVRRSAELVRRGEVDAMVDCGNTAVPVIASLLNIGRIPGVIRSPIAVFLPRLNYNPQGHELKHTLLVDAGANESVSPAMLGQFGLMGSVYVETVEERTSPTIGILSNGKEAEKGTDLVHDASAILSQMAEAGLINFQGNVEGGDQYNGAVDVVVTDGFSGNISLKSNEAMAHMILGFIKGSFEGSGMHGEAADKFQADLDLMNHITNPAEVGGGVLLGVSGITVIGHGASDANAVANAIRQAHSAHNSGLIRAMTERFTFAQSLLPQLAWQKTDKSN